MNINDCAFKNANKMEKSVGSSVFSLLLVCLFLKVKLRLDTMFKMRHEKIKEQMMHESLFTALCLYQKQPFLWVTAPL